MKHLILAALLLSGASSFAHAKGLPSPFTPFTAPSKTSAAAKGSLATLTIADLQAALASANAQTALPVGQVQPAPYNTSVTGGDTRHGNCWAALIQFAGSIQANNLLPSQLGLATAMQTIFNDQQLVGKPLLPDYVVLNCALTFNDANQNLLTLTTLLGVKAITLPKL